MVVHFYCFISSQHVLFNVALRCYHWSATSSSCALRCTAASSVRQQRIFANFAILEQQMSIGSIKLQSGQDAEFGLFPANNFAGQSL